MDIEYRNPKLYFIGGKARSGKSTVGQILKEKYEKKGKKVAVLSHSRYHKDYIMSFFGWDGRDETKPRDLLQQLGTEIIRKKLNMPFFFVNRMTEDIKILSYFFDVIVVNDVRFKIEIDKQREIFDSLVAIKVIRDNFDNGLTDIQKKHASEIDLDDYDKFNYYVYNDGTIDCLKKEVLSIIQKEEKQSEENE